jgi:hypothetical protein
MSPTFKMELIPQGARHCASCQLCCKLLPVRSLDKEAGHRCKHQRVGKGCTVYARLGQVSPECRLWSCEWLVNADAGDLSRPDRSHYVIDVMPDYVTLRDNADGAERYIPVVQVWIDPDYPNAHEDPALRRFLERRAEEGKAAILRFDNTRALVAFAPSISANGRWNLVESNNLRQAAHSFADVWNKLSGT